MAASATTITIPAGEQAPLAMQFLAMSDRPWAITPRAIRAMVRAASHPDFGAAYDAVAARMGKSLPGASRRDVAVHGSTAVLDVRGPLFRYRSIFTWLLGGTAVEDTALALHAALDDDSVKSIVMGINSPGGQIDGINELANMIRSANGQKPVTAYVDSLAGSGAYWLASAAGRVVADETAQLGSIGVLATVVDESAADEKHGVKRFEVVSSQSPLKRTDPATDEGRAQLQQMVDGLAQVFIGKVAQFRGTSPERVEREFGRGAVMSAQSAVDVGMADSLGSLSGLLSGETSDGATRQIRDKPGLRVAGAAAAAVAADPFDEEELEEGTEDANLNSDPANCPPDTQCQDDDENGDEDGDEDGDESEGTEQEPDDSSIPRGGGVPMTPTEDRQRIAAILNCEEAKGREELARTLALDPENTFSVDSAKKILLAAPVAAAKTNALDARMNALANPRVGVPGDHQSDDSVAAEVQRVLAFVPQDRVRKHARVQ
jgi:signal peptide peptidase SppA